MQCVIVFFSHALEKQDRSRLHVAASHLLPCLPRPPLKTCNGVGAPICLQATCSWAPENTVSGSLVVVADVALCQGFDGSWLWHP